MTRRRATSQDVAASAGLSRSTVSQILGGKGHRFSSETQERVRRAAAELDYRPSPVGRALKAGSSPVVVLLVPNTTFGRQLQDTIDQLTVDTAARGYSVVVRYAGSQPQSALQTVLDMMPAVVIDYGVLGADARTVVRSLGSTTLLDADTAAPDMLDANEYIGAVQVDTIMGRNSSRQMVYALLEDAREDPFGPSRVNGARQALARHPLHSALVQVRVKLTVESARAALSKVLSAARPSTPIGVCCYNDDVAIAILAGARALGLDVPRDVAVVGVDATELGQLMDPPLSSVAIDVPALVHHALSLVKPFASPGSTGRLPVLEELIHVIPGRSAG